MTRSRLLTVLFVLVVLAGFAPVASAHYDPSLGRWLERDPAGYSDGANLYETVSSRPLNASDPTGLKKMTCELVTEVPPGAPYRRWIDPKWNLAAVIPGAVHHAETSNAVLFMQRAVFARSYVRLFKCCDATNLPVALWGKILAAWGEIDDTSTDRATLGVSLVAQPVTIPLPYGQSLSLDIELRLGSFWTEAPTHGWAHGKSPAAGAVKYPPDEKSVPTGYKVVKNINCCTGGPGSWPPPGGIPPVPAAVAWPSRPKLPGIN